MRTDADFAAEASLTLPPSFPLDDYTPHGYIDNPHHSMVLNRSGVIRSLPPLGFGYWFRKFKGAYGSGMQGHVNYLSLLQLAVVHDGVHLVTPEDFKQHGIALVSRYHTKHLVSYDFQVGALGISCRYFLPREHTLACLVEVTNQADTPQELTLHATNIFGLWTQRWWGADGVGTRYRADADAQVTTVSAYGDYFALAANDASVGHHATADRAAWLHGLQTDALANTEVTTVRGAGPMHAVLSYRIAVPAGGTTTRLVCLSRGTNEPNALAELNAARESARTALDAQLDEDETFWGRCPQLEGDWPTHWKHGWVYDWETLRMNVRAPLGIFKHHWDAMQVHSPRSVLGEASVDMYTLGHAEAELGRDVMLGTFADAPVANVPCVREDGSMNMVAADGEACGTAPSWCFPFKTLRMLYAQTNDKAWIRALYPYLRDYLNWWFEHRTDEHGWFHCHCDWESGQDGSKRFPEAEGGSADNVATVDVEASMAEALHTMVLFAEIADEVEDRARWQRLADEKTESTRKMFVDGWFRDFDVRTGKPIILDYYDVMMLAPLTCRIATPEQVAALQERFAWFRANGKMWLEWPSFFMAYTEAAWFAGQQDVAAEVAADIADRIYARTDHHGVRLADADDPYAYRIPGIANEYWPVSDTLEPGGENYGWGATLPVHFIRTFLGFRELDELPRPESAEDEYAEFHLAPTLPQRLLEPGRTYTIRNLHFRDIDFAVTLVAQPGQQLAVALEYEAPDERRLTVRDQTGADLLPTAEPLASSTVTWSVPNGTRLTVRFQ